MNKLVEEKPIPIDYTSIESLESTMSQLDAGIKELTGKLAYLSGQRSVVLEILNQLKAKGGTTK